MIDNILRVGNFTSSTISALIKEGSKPGTLGAPALTYISECNMERRLGRCLETEIDTRPTSWGKLCEALAFELLPTTYTLCSTDTISHPTIPYWKGSPDATKVDDEGRTLADIKCPFTLKSFCQLVDAWNESGIDGVRDGHKDGEKFYWQLVSNAILTDSSHAELIVYCPYLRELEMIRQLVEGKPSYYWIWGSSDNQLPFLPDGGYYRNLNVMRFEVPAKDKARLKKRVLLAGKFLVQPELVTA
jgi:hypothetical protein